MPSNAVTEAQVRAMLEEALERIEAGGVKSITINAQTTTGEIVHTFSCQTEDERLAAIVALRRILGKVH